MGKEYTSRGSKDLFNKYGTKVENWREKVEAIGDILGTLKNEGAYDDMVAFRNEKVLLSKVYYNAFDTDLNLNPNTTKTDLFKSFLTRVTTELFMRKMDTPQFDIESLNMSQDAYEEKSKASMAKAYLEWMIRVSGYENVVRESRENQVAFGDRYIDPFLVKIGNGKYYPAVQDVNGENVMLDPNCSSLHSENAAERGQYYATTNSYTERGLIDKYGKWILDYVSPGASIDTGNKEYGASKNRTRNYEVLCIQDRANGNEFELVGANAFPVMLFFDEDELPKATGELKKFLEDSNKPIVWAKGYRYKNSFEQNVLKLTDAHMYYDQRGPRNMGVVKRLMGLQVIHEIIENGKINNSIERLDYIKFLVGGSDRTDKTFQEYRRARATNRNAVWNIPAAMGKNLPVPGVLKFDGVPAQEGELQTQGVMNLSKNSSGVNPQQQEIQKNTAVTQTQIIEEKSTEAIEDVAEQNIPKMANELKTLLYFGIAHDGFGLDDVKINYTKYDKNFPEGNENAQITIQNAAKQLKGFDFMVAIDKSSIIKRSRFLSVDQLGKILQFLDPQATPEWYKVVVEQIGHIMGIPMPEVATEQVQQIAPQGGFSQFTQEDQGVQTVGEVKPQPASIPQPKRVA